jgi:hypothetical protein
MWYSKLVGETWTPLEPITSGPSGPTYDPCCPRAVISQGNQLLATWAHNVRSENLTGAWYAFAALDAPELPVVPLPTPGEPTVEAPSPTPAALVTQAPPPVASTQPPVTPPFGTDAAPNNPALPIFVAAAPAVLLVAALVVIRRKRQEAEDRGRPYQRKTHR